MHITEEKMYTKETIVSGKEKLLFSTNADGKEAKRKNISGKINTNEEAKSIRNMRKAMQTIKIRKMDEY